MRIGLVDIDGHHFPNLALMKLSVWHKSQGDSVEFADPMFGRYDRVYMSKVFTFTPDCPDIYHCEVIRGGTGFRDYTTVLPEEIEHICPDYSLYGVNEAYGFLTRGCPNSCPWCIVPHKEGTIRPASPLREFIGDKRRAVLLDNNVLASDFGLKQIEEIIRMGIAVDFNQGLDARRACDDPYILDLLTRWRDPKEELPEYAEVVEVKYKAFGKIMMSVAWRLGCSDSGEDVWYIDGTNRRIDPETIIGWREIHE